MSPLESARSKLLNPELGTLTPTEIAALLTHSQPQRASKMIPAFIEEILDATLGYERDTARANLGRLFESKEVTVATVKTWTDDDFKSIKGAA